LSGSGERCSPRANTYTFPTFFLDHHESPAFPSASSSSQRSQVFLCLHTNGRCMGYPRTVSQNMAFDEITWLARPQIHLSFSPHFYALRVRRRRYASAPAFFYFSSHQYL
jgi:hypothetical protein